MLAIGGCTIDELKGRMTVAEVFAWRAYRRTHGPLNPILRQDAAIARLQLQKNHMHGGHAQMTDFMPWPNYDEEEATVNDVMSMLTGGKRG